jgi:hypothetical protein
MRQLNNSQEKEIMELENKWLKYKRAKHKACNTNHPDFLSMKQREDILDKLFTIIFND